ncbi:unnamed protein product, partial [Notodromas monacha]
IELHYDVILCMVPQIEIPEMSRRNIRSRSGIVAKDELSKIDVDETVKPLKDRNRTARSRARVNELRAFAEASTPRGKNSHSTSVSDDVESCFGFEDSDDSFIISPIKKDFVVCENDPKPSRFSSGKVFAKPLKAKQPNYSYAGEEKSVSAAEIKSVTLPVPVTKFYQRRTPSSKPSFNLLPSPTKPKTKSKARKMENVPEQLVKSWADSNSIMMSRSKLWSCVFRAVNPSLSSRSLTVGQIRVHRLVEGPLEDVVNADRCGSRFYSASSSTEPSKDSTQPPAADTSEKEIEALKAAVAEWQDKSSDYLLFYFACFSQDKYKRALAESENIRARMLRQIDDAKLFGIQGFCKDLLEVADILGKATGSVPEESLSKGDVHLKSLHQGLVMTEAQLQKVFQRHGLTKVDPVGEKFNPNEHEALFEQVVDGKDPGIVAVVTKIGYKLHQRTLRPALVGVTKAS